MQDSNPNLRLSSNSSNRFVTEHGEAWLKSPDRRLMQYIDDNNLYGYALRQKLTYKEFSFVDKSLDKALTTSNDSENGYSVICDKNYTDKCKDSTRCLQLLPIKRKIRKKRFRL